jgi:hypothetical protein
MKVQSGQFLTTLALCLGAVGLSAAGCELIASVDRQKIDQGGGGGGGTGGTGGDMTGGGMGGTGGTGGAGGMGGTGGGGGGCSKPSDCPPPANECVTATCLNSTCGTMNVPQGMQTATQVEGDCMINQCSGTGMVDTIEDTSDPTDDQKECTTDTCQPDGTTMHAPVNAGTACSEDGGKVCNNAGACVECITTADCSVAGEICQGTNCVQPECANAMKDGSETDIDCGGPNCNPCGTNKNCMAPSDCVSTVCTNMKCQAANCMDMVKNGTETDVDCGGASCPKCGTGLTCTGPADCQSGVCATNACQAATCMDTVKNGTETDVDCGGASCPACANAQMCSMNSDCMSGNCVAGVCAPALPGDGGLGGSGGGGGSGGAGGN